MSDEDMRPDMRPDSVRNKIRIANNERRISELESLMKTTRRVYNELEENIKFNNDVLKTHGQLVPKNQEDITELKKKIEELKK